jgi:hypothetical protein
LSLVAELERRNVFKVGAAYLALGWLVLQLTSIVVPEFGLPGWTTKLVIWIGVIGFPFVVVFSWVYELTPEGLKRESEIDRSRSITQNTGKRLDTIIIALLAVAIGLLVLQHLRPPVVPVQSAGGKSSAAQAGDVGSAVGAGLARDDPRNDLGQGPLVCSPAAGLNGPAGGGGTRPASDSASRTDRGRYLPASHH